jgi:cytochrome P450
MKALSYHVAANPRIQKNLLQELKSVMPHPGSALDLKKPEGLPYFTAVIQEGLRLAIPVSHRLSRIFQQKTLVYQGKVIPPRTAISMTPLLIHQNEDIFPDAEVFRPERWLSDKKLQRYLVAFSRGPRSCLGINLALAELYLVIAKVFRQFNFDVSQVVRERDIDVARDVILGVPRPDSKGVVVKVLISED